MPETDRTGRSLVERVTEALEQQLGTAAFAGWVLLAFGAGAVGAVVFVVVSLVFILGTAA